MPRHCSVKGCKSNYGSQKGHVSTFALPTSKKLRSLWLRNIPNNNILHFRQPVICIKHFEESCIIQTDVLIVKGELKEYPRQIPKLKANAVPTLFPNLSDVTTKVCEALSCTNTSGNSDVIFFNFPMDELLMRKWSTNIDLKDNHYSRVERKFLCSKHFRKNDFIDKLTLKAFVVPSLPKKAIEKRRRINNTQSAIVISESSKNSLNNNRNEAFQNEYHDDEIVETNQCNDIQQENRIEKLKNNPKCLGFMCSVCKYVSTSYGRLKEHLSTHNGEKDLQCKICCKKFAWRFSYRTHMMTHNRDNPNICTICKKRFCNKNSLKIHIRNIHKENIKKNFKCDKCFQAFMCKSELVRHGVMHMNVKLFMCEQCGRTYRYKAGLIVHQKTHGKFKLHPCSVCNSTFDYSSSLINHQRIHSGEKPWNCNQCGKVFRLKRSLTIHMTVHGNKRPFQCATCGKTFRSKSGYRSHIDSHLNLKRHICKYCCKAFRSWSTRNKHVMLHVSKGPQTCDVCREVFTDYFDFKNHVKSHDTKRKSPKNTTKKQLQFDESHSDTETVNEPYLQDMSPYYPNLQTPEVQNLDHPEHTDLQNSVVQSLQDSVVQDLQNQVGQNLHNSVVQNLRHPEDTTDLHNSGDSHLQTHHHPEDANLQNSVVQSLQNLHHPEGANLQNSVVQNLQNPEHSNNNEMSIELQNRTQHLLFQHEIHATKNMSENFHTFSADSSVDEFVPMSMQNMYMGTQCNSDISAMEATHFQNTNCNDFDLNIQHDNVIIKCKLCRAYFGSTMFLKQHLLNYHRVDEDNLHVVY